MSHPYHFASTSGKDDSRSLMRHQFLGARQADLGEAVYKSGWSACIQCRVPHHSDCLKTAFNCCRVGRNYNGVTRFYRDQYLVHHSRGWVGAGNQGCHNPHRPGDFINSFLCVIIDHPNCFDIFNAFPNVFGGKLILEFFVLWNTVSCLFGSQTTKAFRCQISRIRHCGTYSIHLCLRSLCPNLLSLISLFGHLAGFLNGKQVFVGQCHDIILLQVINHLFLAINNVTAYFKMIDDCHDDCIHRTVLGDFGHAPA